MPWILETVILGFCREGKPDRQMHAILDRPDGRYIAGGICGTLFFTPLAAFSTVLWAVNLHGQALHGDAPLVGVTLFMSALFSVGFTIPIYYLLINWFLSILPSFRGDE